MAFVKPLWMRIFESLEQQVALEMQREREIKKEQEAQHELR
ncbi:hypothetical protein ANME2D_02364 [Candidatus Methanoperedens nitroreducens]|uniref:Uncharacterized protein n=1 Tax=Candidatus Methanoperedens nitratireducens TaxID=1392998 RepID=A0A062V774_9EURY|nr:hypothetical protein [Candidatus Methanoperedens nitroreducens]KCZ71629.1 hypothetical protein ANME2D_02364 [Candidatus Methanoperedens nitroreducens]MDJ1421258.1 hypothetical protein [Candidatus Methanoperedens sp.]